MGFNRRFIGNQYWWTEDKYKATELLLATVTAVEADSERKLEEMKAHAARYKDQSVVGFNPGDWRRGTSDEELDPPISYNVIKSVIDTLTSKITMHKPAPRFLTQSGTEVLQEKAKGLEKFSLGIMDHEDVYDKAVTAFRDGCIYGLGVLKIFPKDDKVSVEVIHPSRIIVDNNAALDGKPRTIFQKMYVDKVSLLAMFPNKASAIADAKTKALNTNGALIRDMVEVYECWYLGCGDVPGRHAIFSESATYLDEDWEDHDFPFVFFRYSNDLMGFFGVGLAQELEGIQLEINVLIEKVQRNMNLLSVPYILKPKESEVTDEHLLTNAEARLIEYVGPTPPTIVVPPAIHPQVLQHLETLYKKAFELAGISQLSATSVKPKGINSGVAMRTYNDIETQRFSVIARRWEQLFVDIAKRIIACAKKIATEEGYEITYVGDASIEKINWNDVNMEDDSFVLKVYPASALPQIPAARLERVVEMLQAGMLDSMEARQLLEFPDLEKSNRLANASRNDLEAVFESMLSKGKYIEPIKFQNLAVGVKMASSYYLRAKLDGIKQTRLDLLARWMEEAVSMLVPPPPEPEETPTVPIGQPIGAGLAMPTGGEEMPPGVVPGQE